MEYNEPPTTEEEVERRIREAQERIARDKPKNALDAKIYSADPPPKSYEFSRQKF